MTRKEYEELRALVKEWKDKDSGHDPHHLPEYHYGIEVGYHRAAEHLLLYLSTVEVEA